MKILIDTNVILDVLIKREPYYLDSARVWTLTRGKTIEGYLSAISVNNLYYIVNKLKGHKTAASLVDHILEDYEIISLTKNILKQARTIEKKDFEDLIQYFSALQEGCDFLVTRNKKDFPSGGVKVISPQEILKRL